MLVRKVAYSYLAHIMLPDETVTEVTGTKDFADAACCYDYLAGRANNMGGWLIGQEIERAGLTDSQGTPWGTSIKAYDVPLLEAPKKEEDKVPTIFGSPELFGEYTDTYIGATSVTYKVTKE